jgi:Bacterial regulatory protein, Fis family
MSPTITLVEQERENIVEAIVECKGVYRQAAKKLGLSPSGMRYKTRRHGITRREVSDRLRPAMSDTEKANFAERKLKQQQIIKKNRPENIYGSIDYIAIHTFKGAAKMVEYARLVAEDGDVKFQMFVEEWDKEQSTIMPHGAKRSLSTIIKESGINSIDFCVEVMRACMKRNMEISNIYAGLAHPSVVQTNIKNALKAKGQKDREMFLQHSGWLPVPKGSNINIHAQAGASAVTGVPVGPGLGGGTENTPLPDFEEMTVTGSKIVREESEDSE